MTAPITSQVFPLSQRRHVANGIHPYSLFHFPDNRLLRGLLSTSPSVSAPLRSRNSQPPRHPGLSPQTSLPPLPRSKEMGMMGELRMLTMPADRDWRQESRGYEPHSPDRLSLCRAGGNTTVAVALQA